MFEWIKNCYQWCFSKNQEEQQPLFVTQANTSYYQAVKNLSVRSYNWLFEKESFSEHSVLNAKIVNFFNKLIFEDLLAIANTYGLAFAVSLYERVINACDPINPEDQHCTAEINMRAGYIGLSLAGFDFAFRLVTHFIKAKWKEKPEQSWNITKDIIGKYAFSLQFILFLHTQVALLIDTLRGDGQESEVMSSDFIFALEGIGGGIIAIFGNDLLRKMIDNRSFNIADNFNVNDTRDKAKKLSDASFNAFFGFALGRGTGDTIRGLLNQEDSKAWMIARYTNGAIFYAIQFALAWKKDPAAPLKYKANFQKIIIYIAQALTIAFFGTALIYNMTKNNPNTSIQSISLIVLIALSSIFSAYVTFSPKKPSNQDLDNLHLADEDNHEHNNPPLLASASTLVLQDPAIEVPTNLKQIADSSDNPTIENRAQKDVSNIDNLFMQALRSRTKNNIPETENIASSSSLLKLGMV